MATPEFYNFIRPALEAVVRTPDVHWKAVLEKCIESLRLTTGDLAEMIPSGKRSRAADRTSWALTYLRQAKLTESTKPGWNRPTERGKEFLGRAPAVITPADLEEFEEFRDFQARKAKSPVKLSGEATLELTTPLESIEQSHEMLTASLAALLLDHLKKVQPIRFERIIVDLMLTLGYGGARDDAGEAVGKSGDGGIDGIIKQDRLGLDNIYLQAKRYSDNTIGTGEINSFIGALSSRGATKGVFITTSTFSESAKRTAAMNPHIKVSLIDGRELAKLMIDHDLGVALEARFDVKRIDSDYFTED